VTGVILYRLDGGIRRGLDCGGKAIDRFNSASTQSRLRITAQSNGDLLKRGKFFVVGEKMGKKTVVSIAHSDADLGKKPGGVYGATNWLLVKAMIKSIADDTMGRHCRTLSRPGDQSF